MPGLRLSAVEAASAATRLVGLCFTDRSAVREKSLADTVQANLWAVCGAPQLIRGARVDRTGSWTSTTIPSTAAPAAKPT